MKMLGFWIGLLFGGSVTIDYYCNTSGSGMFLGIMFVLSISFVVHNKIMEKNKK